MPTRRLHKKPCSFLQALASACALTGSSLSSGSVVAGMCTCAELPLHATDQCYQQRTVHLQTQAHNRRCRFPGDAGSRYETDASNGTAHFLEHMAFKGTTVSVWICMCALG